MIGVVIPIEGEAAERLNAMWSALDGLLRRPPAGLPHVTLHTAEEYDVDHADLAIRSVARSQVPFSVYVAGFGVFAGTRPVPHLAVSRAPRLTVLHRVVAQEVGRFATDPDGNFAPDRWVPHITLSREGLSAAQVGAVAERLSALDLAFPLPVAALAVMDDTPDGQRLLLRYPLAG